MANSSSSRLIQLPALQHPLFLPACGLYIVLKFLKAQGLFIPYAHAYGADLLCLPVILPATLAIWQLLPFTQAPERLNKASVIFTFIYCALLFELILPHFSVTYTADPIDVVAYTVGGFLFYRWQR